MEGSREDRYKSSSTSGSSGAHSTIGSTYYNLQSTNHTSKSIQRLPLRISSSNKVPDSEFVKPKTPDPSLSIGTLGSIDPFSSELQTLLLKDLKNPLCQRSGYEKKSVKMPKIGVASNFHIDDKTFAIEEELRKKEKGVAFFLVRENENLPFETDDSQEKRKVAKINKPPNEWEFYISNELRQRLACCPEDCSVIDSIMLIEHAKIYKDKSLLLSSYAKFGTLVDFANLATRSRAPVSESLIFYFAYEMLQIVSQMHSCRIVHADIKPDNFLLVNLPNKNDMMHHNSLDKTFCLRLIDFGQSIDMALLPPGTSFTQRVKTSGFQCTEMLDHKPWTYQTDLFGVLGCIHILLFGKYMKVQKNSEGHWEITEKFKRYWRKEFWETLFHSLLNIADCETIPDLRPVIKTIKEKLLEPSCWRELGVCGMQLLHAKHAWKK